MANQNTVRHQTVWSECKLLDFFKLEKVTPVSFKIEHLGCKIEKLIQKNPQN